MNDDPPKELGTDETEFARKVGEKALRKLNAQRNGQDLVWFGLGMSGLIGWSVAVPTLLGAMLGLWWDRRHPGGHSWTLALLVAGLVAGSANACRWIMREERAIHTITDDSHE
jgi:ATP synthase protein I